MIELRLRACACVCVHRQVTTQKEEALKEVDVAVIGHNAVQQAGVMAQRGALSLLFSLFLFSFPLFSDRYPHDWETGDYEGARQWQSMNASLMMKVTPQGAPQQQAALSTPPCLATRFCVRWRIG